jgi:hypothetical protein
MNMTNQASTIPQGPQGQVSRPEPKFSLLVMCAECGEGIEAPLPLDQRGLALLLAQRGWFTSVMSPPGQGPEVPILFAALCGTCAQKVYPPEVYKVAEERRQMLLQAVVQAPQGTR